MNNINIIGRISSDIIKTYIQQFDKNVVSFSLVFDDRTRETDGKKYSHFIDCEAWDKVADRIYECCYKGMKIGISGHLEQKRWIDKFNIVKCKHIIVISTCEYLSPKKGTEEARIDSEEKFGEEVDLPFSN